MNAGWIHLHSSIQSISSYSSSNKSWHVVGGPVTSDALLDVYDLPLDLMDADDRVGASLGQPHLTLGGGETLQVGRVVAAEEAATVDRSVIKI